MGKVTNYLAFIGGLILLFTMAGIAVESPTGWLLGFMNNPTLWSTSSLLAKIGGAFALVAVSGITVTALVAFRDPTILRAPVALFLLSTGWDIVGIHDVLARVNPKLALLLTAPLMLVYVISLFEWWSGSDT